MISDIDDKDHIVSLRVMMKNRYCRVNQALFSIIRNSYYVQSLVPSKIQLVAVTTE